MIKKLRWKFIRITMASVLAVLLLIVAAVNVINIYQNNRSADSVTQMLLDNGGGFRKNQNFSGKNRPNEPGGPMGKDWVGFQDRFHNKDELAFSTRFFTVTLNGKGEIVGSDLANIASVTEAELPSIVEHILRRGGETGWYQSYRYRLGPTGTGTLLILMEATPHRSSILSVLLITLLVGLTAFLVVFALVALFSRRAIRPISDTYEKQRQFITDASHELKTPLTVIAANTEILDMSYGENEWTQGISRQTEKMRSLIGKMIQMSRLDEGEQTLTFEELDLSEAVYDTAMSFQGVAASKGLELVVNAAPGIRLSGDESALRQTVSILMDNAVKYCDPGGTIEVSLARTGKGLGRALLCVKNSCAAVSSLALDRLFDRFYRADQAHTANNSYGLGLPIAKAITELHRGKISARELDGSQVAFLIELPKAK